MCYLIKYLQPKHSCDIRRFCLCLSPSPFAVHVINVWSLKYKIQKINYYNCFFVCLAFVAFRSYDVNLQVSFSAVVMYTNNLVAFSRYIGSPPSTEIADETPNKVVSI